MQRIRCIVRVIPIPVSPCIGHLACAAPQLACPGSYEKRRHILGRFTGSCLFSLTLSGVRSFTCTTVMTILIEAQRHIRTSIKPSTILLILFAQTYLHAPQPAYHITSILRLLPRPVWLTSQAQVAGISYRIVVASGNHPVEYEGTSQSQE